MQQQDARIKELELSLEIARDDLEIRVESIVAAAIARQISGIEAEIAAEPPPASAKSKRKLPAPPPKRSW